MASQEKSDSEYGPAGAMKRDGLGVSHSSFDQEIPMREVVPSTDRLTDGRMLHIKKEN